MEFSSTRAALTRVGLLLGIIVSVGTAGAQSVSLVAAGSLTLPLSQLAQAFTAETGITVTGIAETGIVVTQTYAPSGTIRQELEGGLHADVFASADMTRTVDAFISYVTSAVQGRGIDPTLQIVFFPQELTVPAPFGPTVLNGASVSGQQFVAFILSPRGQRSLASYGFSPACRLGNGDTLRPDC